ncbi:MAG: hypothetical protein QM755_20805 [Luteolibacter sp.]
MSGLPRRTRGLAALAVLLLVGMLVIIRHTIHSQSQDADAQSPLAAAPSVPPDNRASLPPNRSGRRAPIAKDDESWRTGVVIPEPPPRSRWGGTVVSGLRAVVSEPLLAERTTRFKETAAMLDPSDFAPVMDWLERLQPEGLSSALGMDIVERWHRIAPEDLDRWLENAPPGHLLDSARYILAHPDPTTAREE